MTLGLFACKNNGTPEGDSTEPVTPPVPEISFLDHAVIRPETAPDSLLDGVSDMYMSLIELSGKDNLFGTDYLPNGESADTEAKEILIGHTNRPETEQVLSQLESNEYAVAVVGNKIVITGIVESLTVYALEYFIQTYLGEGADGKIEGDLFYRSPTDTVLLVDKNEPVYTIVRPEYSFDGMIDMCLGLYDIIYDATGIMIPVKTDRLNYGEEHDENTKEILVGDVTYEMLDEIRSNVKPDEYTIEFVGNKVVIFAWSAEGIEKALDEFSEMLTYGIYTNPEGETTVCIVKEDKNGKDDSLGFYTDVPQQAKDRRYDRVYNAYDSTMMLYWEEASEDMLTDYASQLEADGFTKHQELNNDSVYSVTYFKDKVEVCAYYLKRINEFRVTAQDNVEILPVMPYEYEKLCAPAVTQMGSFESYTDTEYGDMGYIIRLEDGTFVIIDGGFGWKKTADLMYETLLAQKPKEMDEIVISAWIITHGHGDHFGVLSYFTKYYSDKVKVKMLLGNDLPDLANGISDREKRVFDYNSVRGKFGGCIPVKVHTGQQFFFPGATFTVLSTHEDIYPRTYVRYNDYASTIFDTVIEDTRFIWLADMEQARSGLFIDMYEKDLKCDVVQIAHHGNSGTVTTEVYQLCDPTQAFWPLGNQGKESRLKVPATKYIYEKVGAENVYFLGDGLHTIWFEKLPEETGGGIGSLGGEGNAEGDHTKNY